MHSSGFFRIKLIARLILKREILGSHMISDQSLLLSTNVLNEVPLNDISWNISTLHTPVPSLIYIYTNLISFFTIYIAIHHKSV